MPTSRFRVAEAALLGVLFLGALFAPAVVQLTHPAQKLDERERRQLAELPALPKKWKRIKSWNKYPARFEAYFNDHFGLRGSLLAGNAWVKRQVFASSSSEKMTVGRDGWLFFNGDNSLPDYRGITRLTPAQLENWRAILEARARWLEKRGIRYLFVIAPNKQSIYPEKMPARITRLREHTVADQLMDYLRLHSRVDVVDLRAPLQAAKPMGQLFWKADTHWTPLGAFVGYRAIFERLQNGDPRLAPRPFPGFSLAKTVPPQADLARIGELENAPEQMPALNGIKEPVMHPFHTRADGSKVQPRGLFAVDEPASATELRAVVFRDSFFIALMPQVAPHFRRSVYFWRQTFTAAAEEKNLAALVEQEKPHVFIDEIVERQLVNMTPHGAIFGEPGNP